jgi:hypothetical protein
MDEFYNAHEVETPVTLRYPIGSNFGGKFEVVQQIRTQYAGTLLSINEVKAALLAEGFIDVTDEEPGVQKIDPETCDPINPGQHEFAIVTDTYWGNSSYGEEPRTYVEIKLYFTEETFEEDYGDNVEYGLTKKLKLNSEDGNIRDWLQRDVLKKIKPRLQFLIDAGYQVVRDEYPDGSFTDRDYPFIHYEVRSGEAHPRMNDSLPYRVTLKFDAKTGKLVEATGKELVVTKSWATGCYWGFEPLAQKIIDEAVKLYNGKK